MACFAQKAGPAPGWGLILCVALGSGAALSAPARGSDAKATVARAAPARAAPVRRAQPPPRGPFGQGADISGVWIIEDYVASRNATEAKITRTIDGGPVPLQPWAEALYRQRQDDDRAGRGFANTNAYCLPGGMPQMMISARFPIVVLQTPGQVTTLHEEMHVHRQIYLDQPHDPDPIPSYLGDSVGHWEGATLVVDTIGRNDKTTIDMLGMPHSDQIHIVERIRRLSRDQLEDVITVEDPKAFTRPWTMRRTYRLQPPGTRAQEYICLDGQRNTPDPVTGRPTFPGAGPPP